jgi:histone-lysine N-methyltransferase SETMAR
MSKVEYCTVITFLRKEGLVLAAIKQCLNGVYGEASPSHSTVKEWARLRRESVEVEPREGRPVEVVTEENIQHIEEELLSDRRLLLKEISVKPEIPKTTIIQIIHEHLHMKKVSARWVPDFFVVLMCSFYFIVNCSIAELRPCLVRGTGYDQYWYFEQRHGSS